VPHWYLKTAISFRPSWNMKSEGNRSTFRLTARTKAFVGTP